MFFKVFLGELIFGREEGDCNKAKYIDHYTDKYFFCWLSMLVALFSDDKKLFSMDLYSSSFFSGIKTRNLWVLSKIYINKRPK